MSDSAPIRVFISGACAGLAEVRQALSAHPDIEIVGASVEPAKATQKLAASGAQVVMHGSSRGDRLPTEDVEAIRQATQAPIVLVTSGSADGLLREALGSGVADVVLLPQLTDALVFTIRRAQVLGSGGGMSGVRGGRTGRDGTIVTVFSPKGGVGTTMLACGLATTYAREGQRVLLVDLDLQFGDVAIMMGVEPDKTIFDLVMTAGDLDPEKLGSLVTQHPSGVHVVPAPVRPEDAELVSEDRVGHLLEVAKEAYDVVIVDTASHFQATMLTTLDRTDRLVVVASYDIPTVKNVKLTLQTLGLLHYPKERVFIALNHAGAKSELKMSDVERALDMKVAIEIPSDREVGVAINRGVPITAAAPRSSVSKAVHDLGAILVPPSRKARKKDAAAQAAHAPEIQGEPTASRMSKLMRKAA